MRYYTTHDQARKLESLGLPKDSADMCYTSHYFGNLLSSMRPDIRTESEYNQFLKSMYVSGASFDPCWSMGKLLDLLPQTIPIQGIPVSLKIYKGPGSSWCSYGDIVTIFGDTLFDAVYNMVVLLLENKYI